LAVSADSTLERIVERLVAAVQPDRLILFGSRATGVADPRSDYDLLIIKPSQEPPHRRLALARQALWGVGAPIDLLWYTPEEVEEWMDIKTHVSTQAVHKGRVVYEKRAG
jgi:predicted nucleotidyltransferase